MRRYLVSSAIEQKALPLVVMLMVLMLVQHNGGDGRLVVEMMLPLRFVLFGLFLVFVLLLIVVVVHVGLVVMIKRGQMFYVGGAEYRYGRRRR